MPIVPTAPPSIDFVLRQAQAVIEVALHHGTDDTWKADAAYALDLIERAKASTPANLPDHLRWWVEAASEAAAFAAHSGSEARMALRYEVPPATPELREAVDRLSNPTENGSVAEALGADIAEPVEDAVARGAIPRTTHARTAVRRLPLDEWFSSL